jgi:transposase-like protein
MTSQSGFIPVEREVEVSAKAERRRFTAEYKRKILKEADACSRPGELGALLRREGLYSSHLAAWRRVREQGGLAGLSPKKRGPRAKVADPRDKRIVDLERDNRRLKARLERAEALIEVQKKVAALLGRELPPNSEEL